MNRARQRKLEARERRIASLANSSLASQGPIIVQSDKVDKKINIDADEIKVIAPIEMVSRIDLIKAKRKNNRIKNLAGAKKSATKTKGKEKING